MKKRNLLLILLCMLLTLSVFFLSACGKTGDTGKDDGSDAAKEQNYTITLFYANEDYVAQGNESLEKFQVTQKDIKAKPADVYKAALEELRTSPEKGYSTMLNDQIKLNDVYLKGDTAYVDLSSSGLSGGSLEETFLVSQIVDTLLNSFSEIKQVQFLVDGKTPETIMGHVDASQPFTKDVFSE